MKLMKLKLLIVALVLLVANSAFAALSYNVTIDTSSLSGTDGYLYFTYIPVNGSNSTATVSNYWGGILYPSTSAGDPTATSATGTLPGTVSFTTSTGLTDYNHGTRFGIGTGFSFLVSFSDPEPGGVTGGSSTFSLGLFTDENGVTPLFNTSGINNTAPGTLFTIDLMNDGSTSAQVLANGVDVTPTPIPAAFWLLGSGLVGLVGIRRKKA